MSEIDKSLPNVEQEIKLPSEEEIVEASQENIEEAQGAQDIEVIPDEDDIKAYNESSHGKDGVEAFSFLESLK